MVSLGDVMLAVPCPRCDAAPGKRCRQPNGKRLTTGHLARRRPVVTVTCDECGHTIWVHRDNEHCRGGELEDPCPCWRRPRALVWPGGGTSNRRH